MLHLRANDLKIDTDVMYRDVVEKKSERTIMTN